MKKLLVILLLPFSLYSQSTQEQIDSLRYYMHLELNEYRAEHRSQKLEISDKLNDFAQNWAETMFKTGEFKHSKRPFNSGENILDGNDYSPTSLISKMKSHWILYHWKNSPGHNKNLIWYAYTKVGYGFYKGYAVQIFE
jgi:uncharacterized protein YkwD